MSKTLSPSSIAIVHGADKIPSDGTRERLFFGKSSILSVNTAQEMEKVQVCCGTEDSSDGSAEGSGVDVLDTSGSEGMTDTAEDSSGNDTGTSAADITEDSSIMEGTSDVITDGSTDGSDINTADDSVTDTVLSGRTTEDSAGGKDV